MTGVRVFVIFLIVLGLSSSHAQEEGSDIDKPAKERKITGKPRAVTVEVVNATSIDVKWQKPRGNKECPAERYLIRLKHDGARRAKTWKIDGARTSLTVHSLLEGTTYFIRLVAVNCEGRSNPTKWVKVRTAEHDHVFRRNNILPGSTREITSPIHPSPIDESPQEDEYEPIGNETVVPGKATYVRTRTFPDSVFVMWRPPDNEDILVRGYIVGYGEGVPDVNWQYVDALRRNVTIKNLKSATQYVISLRAFNNFGKGDVVYDLIYTREKPGPTVGPISQPTQVRAKVLSPSTVWLQWTDPTLGRHQQITDSRYYNVHYQALPQGKTLSVIVKALHVVLYDLTPGTKYGFKVRVIKDSQSSGFSAHAVNKTFETAPTSAPRDIEIVNVPSNTSEMAVRISWKSPRQPNGIISGYLIFYTWNPSLPPSRWMVVPVVPSKGLTQEAFVDGLDSNVTYYFQLQARNQQGYGPMSDTLPYTTRVNGGDNREPDVTAMLSEADEIDPDEEVEAIENEPGEDEKEDMSYRTNEYKDSYREVYGEPVAETLTSEQEVEVASSKTKREQGFLAHGGNGVDVDEQQGSTNKLKVKFQAKVRHHVTGVVTWPDPCPASDAKIVGYIFRYYESHGDDHITNPVSHNLAENFIMLDHLEPDTKYGYQIKYIYDNNTESQWTQEDTLDTHKK